MRALITGIALISLSFLMLPVSVPAKLAEICGSPPGAPCNQEAAARVCLGNETAGLEPKVKAETPQETPGTHFDDALTAQKASSRVAVSPQATRESSCVRSLRSSCR